MNYLVFLSLLLVFLLVPIQDSIDMEQASYGKTHLVTISDCDHKFEGHYDKLVEAVVPWVIKNFC